MTLTRLTGSVGLDGVAGADGLGEVVAGVEEDHVDARARPGEARCASTASPIEEVTQNRLAERRDGPLDDHLGGRELELGAGVPDELLQLGLAAAVGAGAP